MTTVSYPSEDFTGTCAGPQAPDVWPAVRAIQDSIALVGR